MIEVKTEGPTGETCNEWRVSARTECSKLIEQWKESNQVPEPKQGIWKDLKALFLNALFNQKCAYCEGKVSGHFPLDVEHYRPKKKVTENRLAIEHTGYFWLAYEWYNLILACRDCNSSHSSYVSGESISHPGKANEFRILGDRITAPSENPEEWPKELANEQPLLLNPYFDNPATHINFDDQGVPYPRDGSSRGAETIKVCHLERIELVEARREAARGKVKARIYDRLGELERGERSIADPYFNKSEAFSAWLNHYANVLTNNLRGPFTCGESPASNELTHDPNATGTPAGQ